LREVRVGRRALCADEENGFRRGRGGALKAERPLKSGLDQRQGSDRRDGSGIRRRRIGDASLGTKPRRTGAYADQLRPAIEVKPSPSNKKAAPFGLRSRPWWPNSRAPRRPARSGRAAAPRVPSAGHRSGVSVSRRSGSTHRCRSRANADRAA
jgi:hypothetical protein